MKSILIAIVFLGIAFHTSSQEEKYPELAYGEWIYDTEDKDFYSKLILMDDGTFEMSSRTGGSIVKVKNGTYNVEGDKLTLKFESGSTQVNTIEKLDQTHLQFRYIETVYNYRRVNS